MCQISEFMTIIGGIVGSAVTIILVAILKHIAHRLRYKGDIISYRCFDQVKHSFGKAISDSNSNSGTVWEHNNISTATPGECTVWGQYKNDFFEPGRYKITFRCLIDGVNEADPEILKLDVLRWDGDIEVPYREMRLTGKDLHQFSGKYYDHPLSCYISHPGGKWEYRTFVNRELYEVRGLTIRFDTITVSHDWRFFDVFIP
jgi:hypothetical protein